MRLKRRFMRCVMAFVALGVISEVALAQPAATTNAALPSQRPARLAAEAKTASTTDEPEAIRVLLSPELETTLVAPMGGTISQLQGQLGGRVKKGKPVVNFDCSEASARLRMSQAEHAAANETLMVKQRLRKLDAAGDMEVSLAAAEEAKARASIALSQSQMDHCAVPAPFEGRIVKVHVKPYQGVSLGMPLVELISDGPLKVRLNAPSRWLALLRVGTPFEVTINETGKRYPAKVTAINARVDAVAQTIELEARMDNAVPELLAGMSGNAHFRIPSAR